MENAFKLINALINDSEALAAVMSNCDCEVKLSEENESLTGTLLTILNLPDSAGAGQASEE